MPLEVPSTDRPDLMLKRPALAVQLADALRELILEGQLVEGEKIREKELTEQYGVSRTPLREAMKMLAAEGLIALIPNRGAMVSQQSEAELSSAFPVLGALERLAGELAAERATQDEVDQISAMTVALRNEQESGDRAAYFELNQKIHAAILAAARNDVLSRSHAAVALPVHRARYQANLTRIRWEAAIHEHERIAEALRARDGARTGRLLYDHMSAKLLSVLAARRGDASPDTGEQTGRERLVR